MVVKYGHARRRLLLTKADLPLNIFVNSPAGPPLALSPPALQMRTATVTQKPCVHQSDSQVLQSTFWVFPIASYVNGIVACWQRKVVTDVHYTS
jgi:hypothetical protein